MNRSSREMRHEIRNCQNALQLVALNLEHFSDADVLDCMDMIYESADRLEQLMAEMFEPTEEAEDESPLLATSVGADRPSA